MRLRTSILLFVVAAALIAYYAFIERPRQNRTLTERASSTDLADVDPESVDTLTIDRADGRIVFRIEGTHWEMTEPVRDIANQQAVGRLLAAIASARIERNIGVAGDDAQYGLDDPVVIRLAGTTSRLRLEVGGYNVDRSFVYARAGKVAGVLLVPTAIRRYATAPVEDFRNPRVVDFDADGVRAYTIENPPGEGPDIRWTRRASGWFTVAGGDTVAGEPAEVEALLRRLRGLRVLRFVSDSLRASFTAETPRVRMEWTASNPDLTVHLAPSPGGNALVTLGPDARIVETDSAVFAALRRPLSQLRDRRMMRFDPSRLGRIEVTSPDTLATIVRSGSGWSYPNPALGRMDSRGVALVLRAMRNIRFVSVASRTVPPDFDAGATFTLVARAADGTIMDEVWARPGSHPDTLLVAGRRSGVVAKIPAMDLSRLVSLFRRIEPE